MCGGVSSTQRILEVLFQTDVDTPRVYRRASSTGSDCTSIFPIM